MNTAAKLTAIAGTALFSAALCVLPVQFALLLSAESAWCQSGDEELLRKKSVTAATAEQSFVNFDIELRYSLPKLSSFGKRPAAARPDRSAKLMEMVERVCRSYIGSRQNAELFGNPANQRCVGSDAQDALYKNAQRLGLILNDIKIVNFAFRPDTRTTEAGKSGSTAGSAALNNQTLNNQRLNNQRLNQQALDQDAPNQDGAVPQAAYLVLGGAGLLLLAAGAWLYRTRPEPPQD